MSKGILLFANNTNQYKYTAFADLAALAAQKHLNLPISVVTNDSAELKFDYDTVIDVDSVNTQTRQFRVGLGDTTTIGEWNNLDRYTAYKLSPYEQTLLIDVDYFCLSDNLRKVFDTATEFACYSKTFEFTDRVKVQQRKLGHSDSPMFWATVSYFKKCMFAEQVFEFIEHVKLHWEYYSYLYNFDRSIFRNDYALTIAMQTLTGKLTLPKENTLPGNLVNVYPHIEIADVRKDGDVLLQWHDHRMLNVAKVRDMDLHLMNKESLSKNINKMRDMLNGK